MSVLDSLLSRFGYVKASQQYPDYALALANQARFDIPDGSLYTRQANLYQKLTWIASAIDFVAESCAVLNFNVKRLEGEEAIDIPNHEFELRLRQPNKLQSRFEFMRDYFAYKKLTGNVYVYLNRDSEFAPPSELWIIPTQYVKPVPDGHSYIRGYLFESQAAKIPLETWQVMHDKTFNPFNPFVGLSAIESLNMIAQGDIAQQIYSTRTYSKDNAKIPGALAFADMINNADWDRMQAEAKDKWGGLNVSGPMWLRGVGTGGVQWLQMAVSPKDMQALDQRKFTKEEIFTKLAPGLASVLDVNATEANAIAGKAILAEYTLWPMLVSAAEKITSDVLPAYGDNLVGEFDDPRKSDRLIDLQEQQEYAKVHTVNEIRSEYYGDDAIEGGDVPVDAWKGASETPMTPPPAIPPASNPLSTETPAPAPASEAEIKSEMNSWENFALRRLGRTGGREFEPRAIPLLQAARIQSALKSCKTIGEIREIFHAEQSGIWDELKRANDLLERSLKMIET